MIIIYVLIFIFSCKWYCFVTIHSLLIDNKINIFNLDPEKEIDDKDSDPFVDGLISSKLNSDAHDVPPMDAPFGADISSYMNSDAPF